jgi:hypothetical protein
MNLPEKTTVVDNKMSGAKRNLCEFSNRKMVIFIFLFGFGPIINQKIHVKENIYKLR